jgi:hypothetical protein
VDGGPHVSLWFDKAITHFHCLAVPIRISLITACLCGVAPHALRTAAKIMKPIHLSATHAAILVLLLCGGMNHLSAQTISNGDLSKGNTPWKGDRDVEDDPEKPGNKVLVVELKKSKPAIFSQQVDTGDAKNLTFTFEYKVSADYRNDGFRVKGTRADGSFWWQDYVPAPGAWHKVEYFFKSVNGSRRIDFSVEVKPGTGKIFFDNFTVK